MPALTVKSEAANKCDVDFEKTSAIELRASLSRAVNVASGSTCEGRYTLKLSTSTVSPLPLDFACRRIWAEPSGMESPITSRSHLDVSSPLAPVYEASSVQVEPSVEYSTNSPSRVSILRSTYLSNSMVSGSTVFSFERNVAMQESSHASDRRTRLVIMGMPGTFLSDGSPILQLASPDSVQDRVSLDVNESLAETRAPEAGTGSDTSRAAATNVAPEVGAFAAGLPNRSRALENSRLVVPDSPSSMCEYV